MPASQHGGSQPTLAQIIASPPRKASSPRPSKPAVKSASSPGIPRDQSWSSLESNTTSSSVTSSSILDSPRQPSRHVIKSSPRMSVPVEEEDENGNLSPPNTYTIRNSKDGSFRSPDSTNKSSFERSPQLGYGSVLSGSGHGSHRNDDSGYSHRSAGSSSTTSPILGSSMDLSNQRRKRMSSIPASHNSREGSTSATVHSAQTQPHNKRVLCEGGGEGWEWFRRDSIHAQRYHPFPAKEVPYMSPYHREQVDRDNLRDLMLRKKMDILPWAADASVKHKGLDFVPKRVLDIGCGIAASWIVEAASTWPDTHFVGLDVAPLLLPLDRLSTNVCSRIQFIQANFLTTSLSSLFPAEEGLFDFIRLSHIGFGIPESYWQTLLDDLAGLSDPQTGWIQVIESSVPNFLDTESRQWKDGSADIAGAAKGMTAETVGLSGTTGKNVLATARNSQIERIGQAVAKTFSEREVSLFPISIFPAAFVLTCKNVQTDGPLTLEAPTTLPTLASNPALGQSASTERSEKDDWYSTPEGQEEIAMRVFEHAEMDAFAADAFYEGDVSSSSDSHSNMRDYIEYENCATQFVQNIQHRAGLSQLITSRFGWSCEADSTIEEALTRQVEALNYERDLLDKEEVQDDVRLHEIARTLREAKADLESTRMRLGIGEWNDPLGSRKFAVDVLMKAGRKA